jgi:hypothetical protein
MLCSSRVAFSNEGNAELKQLRSFDDIFAHQITRSPFQVMFRVLPLTWAQSPYTDFVLILSTSFEGSHALHFQGCSYVCGSCLLPLPQIQIILNQITERTSSTNDHLPVW